MGGRAAKTALNSRNIMSIDVLQKILNNCYGAPRPGRDAALRNFFDPTMHLCRAAKVNKEASPERLMLERKPRADRSASSSNTDNAWQPVVAEVCRLFQRN